MKNAYFKEMQNNGKRYRNGKPPIAPRHGSPLPPYTEGQSYAFKFWAIADRYNSTQIVVDDLPEESQIPIMIATFYASGNEEIFVANKDEQIAKSLAEHGCTRIKECKVIRKETELHEGNLEILRGSLYRIWGSPV